MFGTEGVVLRPNPDVPVGSTSSLKAVGRLPPPEILDLGLWGNKRGVRWCAGRPGWVVRGVARVG